MSLPGLPALARTLALSAVLLGGLAGCQKAAEIDATRRSTGVGLFGRSAKKGVRLEVTFSPDPVRAASTRSLEVSVALVNDSSRDISLPAGSGRRVEVTLRDATDGRVLGRASDSRALDAKLTSSVVNPGERITFNEKLAVRDLRPGQACVLEAFVSGRATLRATRSFTPQ